MGRDVVRERSGTKRHDAHLNAAPDCCWAVYMHGTLQRLQHQQPVGNIKTVFLPKQYLVPTAVVDHVQSSSAALVPADNACCETPTSSPRARPPKML